MNGPNEFSRLRRIQLSTPLSILFLLLATACTSPPKKSAEPLAGSVWQLVSVQSMDDQQGTTRLSEPARFTLQFGSEGRVTLRLDCNRGSGTYEAAASADGASGTLAFGPVSATRAMCPPPHLDQRLMRDLPYVRSYLLRDGRLFFSLMADGGIYEWQPAGAVE